MDKIVEIKLETVSLVIDLVICDNIKETMDKYFMLRSFYQSLSEAKKKEIDQAVAFTYFWKGRLISSKYGVVTLQGLPPDFLVHESFHLLNRIMGVQGQNVIDYEKSEEYQALILQDIYRKLYFAYKAYE